MKKKKQPKLQIHFVTNDQINESIQDMLCESIAQSIFKNILYQKQTLKSKGIS
jgi:hypothetical protein